MNKILALLIVILAIGAGWWLWQRSSNTQNSSSSQVTNTGSQVSTSSDTTASSTSSVKEFTITGSPYKFVPNAINVNKGDTVKITFVNAEGTHDLVIDEFNVRTGFVKAGQSETVTFVADKAGSFQYYCSVGTHRQLGMWGTLTVN